MIMADQARSAGPLGADRREEGPRIGLEEARGIGMDVVGCYSVRNMLVVTEEETANLPIRGGRGVRHDLVEQAHCNPHAHRHIG